MFADEVTGQYSQGQASGDPDASSRASYLTSLRPEARQLLVARLIRERIANGGYENAPARHRGVFGRCCEAVAVGVVAGVVTALVVEWLRGGRK